MRHVPGVFNPADLYSRGLSPDALVELKEFHQGPQFLLQNVSSWPTSESIRNDEREEDIDVNLVDFEPENNIIDSCIARYPTKIRLNRVIAWCLRFIRNCRVKTEKSTKARKRKLEVKELTVSEYKKALAVCRAQLTEFESDMRCLE